jgi:hypothetical protein
LYLAVEMAVFVLEMLRLLLLCLEDVAQARKVGSAQHAAMHELEVVTTPPKELSVEHIVAVEHGVEGSMAVESHASYAWDAADSCTSWTGNVENIEASQALSVVGRTADNLGAFSWEMA